MKWVPKHPDTKSSHDFQNPSFDQIKSGVIRDYLKGNVREALSGLDEKVGDFATLKRGSSK